ncbi:phage baseplate assembly protein V [Photorhabdus heterorhabditis]|uniref:Phage baseplate assembly protein V n=1 Tax=Photorhabdus heterorhabditis TaxID=880156 RepID=A0A5B0VIK8_9GAMM|nr:phage baseplate assembly protein V [Photorhabdus heterorhabditis]KAA1174580.1 phage baseplate assembly protein V [Photorhabdus heterorhabditis]KOY62084.1 phage baseplate protein [Photorhabdus heterorhabditis]MBS9443150.1 phage baseplate assembly protein V [Photorhabdus heterorhabditis]
MDTQLTELLRLLRNLIRTGVVTEVDTQRGMCRIATGNLETDWRPWLTMRAGNSRTWWAPSRGEQVLLLSVGGELTTSFVLPAVYSNQFPEPSTLPTETDHIDFPDGGLPAIYSDQSLASPPRSEQAVHIAFPDGAVMEYEPKFGALVVKGIKTASVKAANSITLEATNITLKAYNKIGLESYNEIGINGYNKVGLESYNKIGLNSKNEIGLEALNKIGLDSKNEIGLKAGKEMGLKASKIKLEGDVENTGGKLSSNGVTLHSHQHSGVMAGGATTGGPV